MGSGAANYSAAPARYQRRADLGRKDAEGKPVVPGTFAAVPYCIDLIGGPYLETNDEVCKAFRPKTAVRK